MTMLDKRGTCLGVWGWDYVVCVSVCVSVEVGVCVCVLVYVRVCEFSVYTWNSNFVIAGNAYSLKVIFTPPVFHL